MADLLGQVRIRQLSRQPSDCGVVHGHRLGDRPAALASLKALDCLALLVVGELRFAAGLCIGDAWTASG